MARYDRSFITCSRCKWGIFMQWYENPVIAYCQVKGDRWVAESRRQCPLYQPSGKEDMDVTHFDTYEAGQVEALLARVQKK